MVTLKSFLIHLIILTYEITYSFHFNPYKLYSVGVSGALSCKFSKKGFIRVFISKDYRRHVEKNYIASKIASYGTIFYLVGTVRSFRKPYVFVKIVHNCMHSKANYERIYVSEISQRCIVKGKKPQFCFMGIIELSDLKWSKIRPTGLDKFE